ncbi:hypothetical protein GCM10023264_07320 [Sphingomonas daechungensis]|uniref:Uncharacterized protein n=1 Tax=Sphingomonas daechungensis TaxID=1176646 RepID=A0ABX6T251_9SPHN|nr:hypothetical protein [Sphingomonas daechungensis]QNP43050.1 hypothetical protein H9L15_13925 [Sphingomonas daechungensis]
MRKLTLVLAAAGSALAIATPAAAQYYPQPYGNDRGYGNEYGYNRGYADAGGLHRRIENVLKSIDGIRPDMRRQIYSEAIGLDRALRMASRNGLNPWEAREFDQRIYQLEIRQGRSSWNRGGRYGGYDDRYYRDDRRDRRDRWDGDDD